MLKPRPSFLKIAGSYELLLGHQDACRSLMEKKKKEKQTWLHFSNMMLLVERSWVFAAADIVMMGRLHHRKKTNTRKCARHIFQSQ